MISIPRNNSNFSSTLFEFYRSLSWAPQWNFLKYYQNTIRAYCDFVDASSNGILAYLGMGTGKSILAASIAYDMITGCADTGFDSPHLTGGDERRQRGRKVKKAIFILNKSLAANMRGAFVKYFALKKAAGLEIPADVEGWINKHVFFVSMNASNMVTQFVRAATGQGLSGKLRSEDISTIDITETFIAIDEAHGFFRGTTNGSKNGLGLFKILESSFRRKNHGNFALFLSGTPINNDALETVPCMNLLGGEGTLPEDYEDFREAFVSDDGSRKMKNETHFMDRIAGLVAYVTHESTPGKKIRGDADVGTGIEFPEDLGVSAVLCPMAPDQYAYYSIAREQEAAEGLESARKGPKARGRMQLPRSNATSSYRTKSRQLSNFYEGGLENRDVAAIKNAWTPKYDALLKNIEAHNAAHGTLGLMYSQYVGIGGLGSFAAYLKEKGWKEYSLEYVAEEAEETEETEETNADDEDNASADDKSLADEHVTVTDAAVMKEAIVADSIEHAPVTVEGGIEWAVGVPTCLPGEDGVDKHCTPSSGVSLTKGDVLRDPYRHATRTETSPYGGTIPVIGPAVGITNHLTHLSETATNGHITLRTGAAPKAVAASSLTMDPYAYVPMNTKARKNKIRRGRGEDDDEWSGFMEVAPPCSPSSPSHGNLWGDDLFDDDAVHGGAIVGGSKFHNEDGRNAPLRASKTFAVIKGGLSPESRKRIEDVMTSPDNRHGEVVSMVLVSSVGAEGLDFKAIRHVHILEPYWNWARILQIQYRGIRNDSHRSLPADEKNVKTYVYCAVPPRPSTDAAVTIPTDDMIAAHVKDVTTLSAQELLHPGGRFDEQGTVVATAGTSMNSLVILPDTTDVSLLYEAIRKYQIISSFLGPMQRASITAAIDDMPGARLCAPTGTTTFTKDVAADLKMPDSCRPYIVKKVEAKSVTVLGHEYVYVPDEGGRWGFRIFMKDNAARPTEVLPKAPEFMTILGVIEDAEGLSLGL